MVYAGFRSKDEHQVEEAQLAQCAQRGKQRIGDSPSSERDDGKNNAECVCSAECHNLWYGRNLQTIKEYDRRRETDEREATSVGAPPWEYG